MGWSTQSDNDVAKIQVKSDNCDSNGDARTDFLIIDKSDGMHNHISVDQSGNVSEWHGYDRKG